MYPSARPHRSSKSQRFPARQRNGVIYCSGIAWVPVLTSERRPSHPDAAPCLSLHGNDPLGIPPTLLLHFFHLSFTLLHHHLLLLFFFSLSITTSSFFSVSPSLYSTTNSSIFYFASIFFSLLPSLRPFFHASSASCLSPKQCTILLEWLPIVGQVLRNSRVSRAARPLTHSKAGICF